jgi:hypothetical protein
MAVSRDSEIWDEIQWRNIVRQYPGIESDLPVAAVAKAEAERFFSLTEPTIQDRSRLRAAITISPSSVRGHGVQLMSHLVDLGTRGDYNSIVATGLLWDEAVTAIVAVEPNGESLVQQSAELLLGTLDGERHAGRLFAKIQSSVPEVVIGSSVEDTVEATIRTSGEIAESQPATRFNLGRLADDAEEIANAQPENPMVGTLATTIRELVERNIRRIDGEKIETSDGNKGYDRFPDYGEIGELLSASRLLKSLGSEANDRVITW